MQWFFSLLIVITSLIIYYKTKEIYFLTERKGIQYFRNVFLFFAIAQASRLIIKGIIIFSDYPFKRLIAALLQPIFSTIAIYASSVTFLYLILTLFHKEIKIKLLKNQSSVHLISILIALISISQKTHYLFFIFQLAILLIIILLIALYKEKIGHKMSSLYWIYLIIFGNWVIIQFLEIFTIFFPELTTIIYLTTIFFFGMLLEKILNYFRNPEK